MALRVLITNFSLCENTGSELYVRDLALELRRQGHEPAVFASRLGPLADGLKAEGIAVEASCRRLAFRPDVIHAHHCYETLSALLHYPRTPALFVCHNHQSSIEVPPPHPRILRYYGMSGLCVDRLRRCGVPGGKLGRMYNFVDLRRFEPRPPLPAKPRRALILSNCASRDTFVAAVEEACRQSELELSVVGRAAGNAVERPEEILGHFDVVFAKAKAAMEAMAVGAAVVLCDFGGVGPMVTPENFALLREANFGFEALTEPHSPEAILHALAGYNPEDAQRVSIRLRSCSGLATAASELVDIYHDVIAAFAREPSDHASDLTFLPRLITYSLGSRALRVWLSLPQEKRTKVINTPLLNALRTSAKRATSRG